MGRILITAKTGCAAGEQGVTRVMAWSISISPEGWQEIYEACHRCKKSFLWDAVNETLRQQKQPTLPRKYRKQTTQENLADNAYLFIHSTNTCDNGGFKFWIDPKGYYKVTIS